MDTETEQQFLATYPLAASMREEDRRFLLELSRRYRFSFQQMRMLVEQSIDLSLWDQGSLSMLWNDDAGGNLSGKPRTKAIIDAVSQQIDILRKDPTDYSDFTRKPKTTNKATHIETLGDERLLGRCPCPVSGEKTRCCNLLTLDVVQQCAFACSYCSIQSFYHKEEIQFAANLAQRLETLELPEGAWHIGTGQSSDSLMWGNDHGILDALSSFATKHPQIVLELKTKSGRTDWLDNTSFPRNMVASWSLNAPTVIRKEEHLTATLEKRFAAARKAADCGMPVGFHLHPMVHFTGWEEEYRTVVDEITTRFSPEEVVMVSLGTLTFTKEVLKQLRESGRPSRILQMELTETAGKYSYPVETKQQMFSHAYNCFPKSWKTGKGPFFYLCMELPQLWEPVFGYSFPDNASFEAAMRRHYREKVFPRS